MPNIVPGSRLDRMISAANTVRNALARTRPVPGSPDAIAVATYDIALARLFAVSSDETGPVPTLTEEAAQVVLAEPPAYITDRLPHQAGVDSCPMCGKPMSGDGACDGSGDCDIDYSHLVYESSADSTGSLPRVSEDQAEVVLIGAPDSG